MNVKYPSHTTYWSRLRTRIQKDRGRFVLLVYRPDVSDWRWDKPRGYYLSLRNIMRWRMYLLDLTRCRPGPRHSRPVLRVVSRDQPASP
jgi:hypothetical protein